MCKERGINSSVFFLSLEVAQEGMEENILFRVLCNPAGLSSPEGSGIWLFLLFFPAIKVMSVHSVHHRLAPSG